MFIPVLLHSDKCDFLKSVLRLIYDWREFRKFTIKPHRKAWSYFLFFVKMKLQGHELKKKKHNISPKLIENKAGFSSAVVA